MQPGSLLALLASATCGACDDYLFCVSLCVELCVSRVLEIKVAWADDWRGMFVSSECV